jgi:hypothetical protein
MMKKKILFACMILFSLGAMAQENMVTISGGYAFANLEDNDAKGTGWRINGSYEFNTMGGKFAHGIAFGFVHLTAEDASGVQTSTSRVNSFPIYYAPKLMFGNDKVKFFVKGALGAQFAHLEREATIIVSDNDMGFYGGGGAGLLFFINEKIFINLEYEIAWASNSFYKDGWINSAMGGIGFKF